MSLEKPKTPIEKIIHQIDENIIFSSKWREKYIQFENEYIELSNLKAIQEYLLGRGANDEEINDKIKKITKK